MEGGIRAKLFEVQQELQVPKDEYNNFGKYRYRSAETILREVKPLLKKNNLVLTLDDDMEVMGDRYYIRASAILLDLDSGESITTHAWAREEESKKGMDGSQVTGASSSYARKYALNGLFAIDDVKDSDTTNQGQNDQQKADNPAPRPQQNQQNQDQQVTPRKRVRK